MGQKTRVFLTGATGVMGTAGMEEISAYPDDYDLKVLVRDTKNNRKKIAAYECKGVEVIWGDLLDKEALRRGIEWAEIVLHVGGMVTPRAEKFPEETMRVNVGSMEKIAEIVKEIEERETDREIKVVYIGSVSQYGSKLPPDHWGSAEDKENPVKNDVYAESKVRAEKVLKESGIKKWVSIRQTSILHSGLLKNAGSPVAFHTPLKGVLEWITTEDSGRLLERVCRQDVPEDFWCKIYNAGGGEAFRLTNLEFMRGILKGLGCPSAEKVFEPNWFAGKNFHGMWFKDSDALDEILHFRGEDNFEEAMKRIKKTLPWYYNLAVLVPPIIIKAYMKRVASTPGLGPLWWIKTGDEENIRSHWGSIEEYKKIPGWKGLKELKLEKTTPKKEKSH